jgi:Zn-finger nucleic acid-binding protein
VDCPKDGVEFETKDGEVVSLQRCTECGGIWLDVADLNRILLRHNMPGLEKLGGTANLEEIAGQCPTCHVDLMVVEGGSHKALRYDTCESCGGIWLEQGLEKGKDVGSLEEMSDGIVDFFKRFAQHSQH